MKPKLDIQGHRGARGLLPENSIPAFIKALELGVTTLELDLAVTKDGVLVVSHEPWMNPSICLDPDGQNIAEDDPYQYNIFQLTLTDVRKFDCGSMGNASFPAQKPMAVTKPTLGEVFDAVDAYLFNNPEIAPPQYNIEIKSLPQGDDLFHPAPEHFSDQVFQFIDQRMDWDRVNIQSFDFRVLQYFHGTYPAVKLAVLIENELSADENLNTLGFIPEIYSCWYRRLSKEVVAELQQQGMLVIPWTVNSLEDMQELIAWGVDGIITDYPDKALQLN